MHALATGSPLLLTEQFVLDDSHTTVHIEHIWVVLNRSGPNVEVGVLGIVWERHRASVVMPVEQDMIFLVADRFGGVWCIHKHPE